MNTSTWIARTVSSLLPDAERKKKAESAAPPAAPDGPASSPAAGKTVPERSIAERLDATLPRKGEAMAPRTLRRTLESLKAIVDPGIGEVEGGRLAGAVIKSYAAMSPEQRRDVWLLMSERFVADPKQVKQAQARFSAAVGTPDEAAAEVLYRRATVSPRRRLLQRFSADPAGIRFLVDLRAEMLVHLKADRRLRALDVEMEYMFSTWFDTGFLELRRISWDSPASLVEKLIRYEAVHDVRGWDDMKNRLDSDRRCYAFFHPRLEGEPLIFVEVALLDHMASEVMPLLDVSAGNVDLNKVNTAIFYSISNTQAGLKGVSFGDSLIKRVVEALHDEFPRLKTYATLSPIPGLRPWLLRNAARLLELTPPKEREQLAQALQVEDLQAQHLLADLDRVHELDARSPRRKWLLRAASQYLASEWQDGKPVDAVARFHLGNGARVERINWAADLSPRGLRQSCGMMVNYLYDLKRLDKHRAALAAGTVPASRTISSQHF
ncbi:MAG: malonyl-CoA decarboxylase [Burkholderiaceae bacterium]|nr:malonyl-CoA decarboxylase [Burkholderiaceae bacterium]